MLTAIDTWVEKADRSHKSAELLLQQGHADLATSQSFYTMFYLAKALLLSKGLAFSRETRVITAFGKEFKKTGLLDARIHQFLIASRTVQDSNNFDVQAKISEESAHEMIDQAREFLLTAPHLMPAVETP